MRYFKKILPIIILFYFNPFSQSLEWKSYTSQNSALPDDRVWDILVDKDNNKWLATSGGLVNYDGQNWTIHNIDNSLLPSNYITCLSEDKAGNLWIGTSKGLVSFDGENWELFTPENSEIPDTFITAIEAIDSGVWVGAMNWRTKIEGGLGYYDGSQWTIYKRENSDLPDNRIASIFVSPDSTVWIGTLGGFVKYYKNTWKIYQSADVPNVNIQDVESISIDSQNRLWLASKAYPILWDGITEGGLIKLVDTSFTVFNSKNVSFPNYANSVNYVYVDHFNNIWSALWYQDPGDVYGTWGSALAKFNGKDKWDFYTNELVSLSITSIEMDKSNHLWIATQNGLTEMIDSTLTSIEEKLIKYDFSLFQNYPNPFNPETTISFSIPYSGKVIVKIFNTLGEEVKILLEEYKNAGSHKITFDGSSISSGVYYYKIIFGNHSEIRKMVLLK